MAVGFGCACPKLSPRVVERQARKAADARAEKLAKAARWVICGGRCEWIVKGRRCGRRIERVGLGMLNHAVCHHVILRSHLKPADKWKVENLRYICPGCDGRIHGRERAS